jgi:hypothetical protein
MSNTEFPVTNFDKLTINDYEQKYAQTLLRYQELNKKLINTTNYREQHFYEKSIKKQLKKLLKIGIMVNSLKTKQY